MPRNSSLYRKAKSLRKEGRSYSELNQKLGIPKSTLSNWFSNKDWSRSVKSQLAEKWKDANKNRILEINSQRKAQTLRRHRRFRQKAAKEFQSLKSDPLFLTGLSIYWGEGEKAERGRVSVINSDPTLLEVVVNFYRKTLGVPNSKLRAAVFLYEDHDLKEALNFWSKVTKIPIEQFIKTQVLPSRSTHTRRKVKHGICNVYFSSTEMNIKIKEWTRLLHLEMRE